MNQLALTESDKKTLSLIRSTVAKDTNPEEFQQFIHICKAVGLDPIRRQIYCFVFNKNDPKKRQMTVVTSIGGLRTIAYRTGEYMADDEPAKFVYDESLKGPGNPLGIVSCQVGIKRYAHGGWHRTVGEAYWDEYVPLDREGKIDWRKSGWSKMPRIMLAKCAEAQALRRAWPDDFASLHGEDELDRSQAIDLNASEAADAYEAEKKLDMIGGKDAYTIAWNEGGVLARIPAGKFADDIIKYIRDECETSTELKAFWSRNAMTRAEFKANHGSDYHELQVYYEELLKERIAHEPSEDAA